MCTWNYFCVYFELFLCVPQISFLCTSNYFCVYLKLFLCVRRIIFCVFSHKSLHPCVCHMLTTAVCCHGRFLGNLKSVINLLISEHEFESVVVLQTRHRLLDTSGTANSVIRDCKKPRRRRQQKPHKFAYLTMKNSIFARFARAFFIF